MKKALLNGHFYLERDKFAEAVLIEDGIIAAVGSNEEIRARMGDAETVDLGGGTVLPGFNDSHMHILNFGAKLLSVDLMGVRSIDEMVERVNAYIDEHHPAPDAVITGRGWNQDYFDDGPVIPTRQDLDRIKGDYAVRLTRACGHLVVANTRMIERAGVTAETPQPEGGRFELGPDGTPNGLFRETAGVALLDRATPAPTRADLAARIESTLAYAAHYGITSLQSNDVEDDNWQEVLSVYEELDRAGKLKARVYHQCCFMSAEPFQAFLAAGYRTGKGTDYQKVGPFKLYTDGSLGARTALLREDYADDPGNRGIECISAEGARTLVRAADAAGMQVSIHCIGDAAICRVLDIYEEILGDKPNAHRHGIIHCQIMDEGMLERIVRHGILVQAQPIFLHYDLHIVEDRVGKALAETSYPFGSLYRRGAPISYGTDAPVEDLNPFENLHCAVTREDLNGYPAGGYVPSERVDIASAIDIYTMGGAYTSFEENRKGRIKEGYLADLVLLDRDIFTIPEEEIKHTQALATWLGGECVFGNPGR